MSDTPGAPDDREGDGPGRGFDAATVEALATVLGTAFADLVVEIDRRIARAVAAIGEAAQPAASLPPLDGGTPSPAPASSNIAATAPSASPPAAEPLPPLTTAALADYDFTAGWAWWQPGNGVEAPRPGVIAASDGTAGTDLTGPPVPLPGGGLVRIVVTAALPPGPRPWHPRLRLSDEHGTPLGAEIPLADGETEAFFFAPAATEAMAAAIITAAPVTGRGYAVRRIALERVEPESYFAQVRARAAAPTVATLTSTPAGRATLPDAVASLLLGCERVRVYLEGYAEIPAGILHPRVEIRRARDWDKRGDAGAFAWTGDDDRPGYRLVASDRLIYPPDFAATMTARLAAYGDRAVVGLGATLLRQPLVALDDPGSAAMLAAEEGLAEDRTVHLLDLDAVAYRSGAVTLTPGDFAYRGLAGLWLARHAQRHGVPLVAAARPAGWVRRPGGPTAPRDRLPADAAAVAAATLRRLAPVTLQPSSRPKAAVVVAVSSAHDLEGFLRDWRAARRTDTDWVLVLAVAAEAVAAARTVLADLDLFHEVHLAIATAERPALGEAMALLGRLGCDAAAVTSDQVRFKSRGALAGLVATLAREGDAILAVPPPPAAPGERAGGPLMIACGRDAIAGLPPADRRAPPHLVFADWAARAAARGRPLGQASGDALVASHLHAAIGEELATWQAANGPLASPPATPTPVRRVPGSSINALFERVVVLNLDRQADRWAAAQARLARAGIAAERFRAVDPAWPETMRDYFAYAGSAPVAPPPTLRAVASPLAFYKDYDSQTARVGHLERRDGRKAIASLAQWAALRSRIAVIEKAMADGVGSLLVLDDGVVFHRDAQAVVAAAAASLPEDWMVLQLGTRLDRWDPAWVTWRSPHLYSAGGAVAGAYALGLRFDAYASLLDHARRHELPFDLGALATVTRDFAERCFVVSPHVAIVPPAADEGAGEPSWDDRGGYDLEGRAPGPGEPFSA